MLNSVVIEGRLVREPEPRSMPNGKTTLAFTLAVNRDYKNDDGSDVCDWIDCKAFGKTAEQIARYCTKGSLMLAQGRLEFREFTGRDGNKKRVVEVYAERVYFVDKKKAERDSHAEDSGNGDFMDINTEDIPF